MWFGGTEFAWHVQTGSWVRWRGGQKREGWVQVEEKVEEVEDFWKLAT